MSDNGDLVDRSDALDDLIEDSNVEESLRNVSRYTRRTRFYVRLVVLSLVLDVVLSLIVLRVARDAGNAANLARSVQQTNYYTCLAANESRAGQLQLWNYVLQVSASQPPTQPLTQEQERKRQEQIVSFRDYIQKLFAPRDCSNPSRLSPSTSTSKPR